jgi:hypothetical protein
LRARIATSPDGDDADHLALGVAADLPHLMMQQHRNLVHLDPGAELPDQLAAVADAAVGRHRDKDPVVGSAVVGRMILVVGQFKRLPVGHVSALVRFDDRRGVVEIGFDQAVLALAQAKARLGGAELVRIGAQGHVGDGVGLGIRLAGGAHVMVVGNPDRAVRLDGRAAYGRRFFEDDHRSASLGRGDGGGKPGRAGARHHHVEFLRPGISGVGGGWSDKGGHGARGARL